jgi:hypothetical protein
MTLIQLHLIVVSAWLGILAAEAILELRGPDPRTVAVVHGWIDILLEGPVVIAVLVTGALLLAGVWPAPPLLLVKAGVGLVPIVVNLICIKWANERWRETDDVRALVLTRRVKLTGLAIPLIIVALAIGLRFGPAY